MLADGPAGARRREREPVRHRRRDGGRGERVLGAHAQVRNVFRAPLLLDPLSLAEVHALLRARYEGWRLGTGRDTTPDANSESAVPPVALPEIARQG